MFRLLLRVGEAAREGGSADGRVDLVRCLKSILAAQGITVIEGDDDEDAEAEDAGEETRSVNVGNAQAYVNGGVGGHGRKRDAGRRRVSFDDARLDETWLSEHPRSLLVSPPPQQQSQRNLLAQPARRGRLPDGLATGRARSISSQRINYMRQPAPKQVNRTSPSTFYTSELDEEVNPTLLFQPSQTQLEQNAEAFASTSAIRSARKCLHIWHDIALQLHNARQQAYAIAEAHDGRTLLKQAFDQWRTHFSARQHAHREEARWDLSEKNAERNYLRHILGKVFTHWHESMLDQHVAKRNGQRRILAIRYFRRWRNMTVENTTKARSILARKYLAVWREKLARKLLRDEQASAHYEEAVTKRCWKAWFWHFCSRRVEEWREEKVKRRALGAWIQQFRQVREREARAEDQHSINAPRRALSNLRQRLAQYQQAAQQAQAHRDRRITATCLHTVSVEAKLSPLHHVLTLKLNLNLQRKALRIWDLHLRLSRQATEVDRQRILQSAWTNWNDALRCKALAQRIDERVVVEALYKWVLAERLRLFTRAVDARLLRQMIEVWRARVGELDSRMAVAEAAFAEGQQRRRLSFGMGRLHAVMRKREDAERAAVEFANARALPNVLSTLSEKTRHIQELHNWAAAARFYTLCTRSLAVWKERTTQHVHNRRRDGYARIRTRVKIRLVGSCLSRWRAQTADSIAIDAEGERRAQARLFHIGTSAFDRWRERSALLQQMDGQATTLDHQRLLGSALSALAFRHAQVREQAEQAQAFHAETQLALLAAAALKKLQWAQFTAARRAESAEALWARNRDLHVRQMLRHWYSQTLARKAAREPAPPPAAAAVEEEEGQQGREVEPESPSLRPASRAASRSRSRSAQRAVSPAAATPAYMRTPSRSSRRAGRFRPLLPTPAPGTPFGGGFEEGYLVTTPAPLPLPFSTFVAGNAEAGEGVLTPQVTPFARKLRAGGFGAAGGVGGYGASTPAPALRTGGFGRSVQGVGVGGTAKSVRFAGGSRFGGGGHEKSS